ncbi:MAG TPA: tetratricopeptide repeat protein [Bryobacteraceae bacterium]|nr:tetratricopeptide repeat protein [Bryobacteraceae bacterium]
MSRGRICAVLMVASALSPAAKTVLGQTESNGLPPPLVPKTELPPDEDQKVTPRTYSFNPVQSQREVTAGDFYYHKGNYTAAASRYEEATKWNDGNAEAWLRLGEAEEKKSNPKAAAEAYRKYLELSPAAKNANDVKKKLAKLKG